MTTNSPGTEKKLVGGAAPVIRVWALAGEVGFLIVIPLLVLLLIGIRLDRWANTMPLFIIISLILSFITSAVAIARKIKRIQEESK